MPFNIKFENNILYLNGDLTIENVMFVRKRSANYLLSGEQSLTIDCAALQQIDTSALALMLDWLRRANQENIKLQFRGFSTQLCDLIKISGLESILTQLH